MAASIRPFAFDDLDSPSEQKPTPAAAEETAPALSAADLEQAYRNGFVDGEAQARAMADAAEAQALEAAAAALARARDEFVDGLAREREAARALTGAFLERFCAGVGAQHALTGAVDLLDQLIAADDRQPARLKVGGETGLVDRLRAVVAERGADDFVAVEADAGLAAGECRCEWRGGSVSRDFSAVRKAVDALLCADRPGAETLADNPQTEEPS